MTKKQTKSGTLPIFQRETGFYKKASVLRGLWKNAILKDKTEAGFVSYARYLMGQPFLDRGHENYDPQGEAGPEHSKTLWQEQVSRGETLLGYHDWIDQRLKEGSGISHFEGNPEELVKEVLVLEGRDLQGVQKDLIAKALVWSVVRVLSAYADCFVQKNLTKESKAHLIREALDEVLKLIRDMKGSGLENHKGWLMTLLNDFYTFVIALPDSHFASLSETPDEAMVAEHELHNLEVLLKKLDSLGVPCSFLSPEFRAGLDLIKKRRRWLEEAFEPESEEEEEEQ